MIANFSPELINGAFALGGAVLGALIAGGFSIWISKKSERKKQITLSHSFPSNLIAVHDNYNDVIKITIGDKEITNLILVEAFISNTGNVVVEDIDFSAMLLSECIVVSTVALDQKTEMLRDGSSTSTEDDKVIRCKIDYLNPGEEVALRLLVTGDWQGFQMNLRQPGLNIINNLKPVSSHSDVLAAAFIEAIKETPMHSIFKAISSEYRNSIEKYEKQKHL